MPRSVNNVAAKKRKKKWLKEAKGFRGSRSNLYKTAKDAVQRAWMYSYRDRRTKKRNFRKLWITRINAGARLNGMSYSSLINKLKKANIDLDRKALAFLAYEEPKIFAQICEKVK